jgi:hypothetical protein
MVTEIFFAEPHIDPCCENKPYDELPEYASLIWMVDILVSILGTGISKLNPGHDAFLKALER